MQRDMDMIRELLLRIEAVDLPAGSAVMLSLRHEPLVHPGENIDSIAYHMRLLITAGLVDPTNVQGADSFGIRGLTWSGHDFLDSIRDPEIWRQTKEAANKAGGFTLDLLADLAKGFIKTQLEKHTGVKL